MVSWGNSSIGTCLFYNSNKHLKLNRSIVSLKLILDKLTPRRTLQIHRLTGIEILFPLESTLHAQLEDEWGKCLITFELKSANRHLNPEEVNRGQCIQSLHIASEDVEIERSFLDRSRWLNMRLFLGRGWEGLGRWARWREVWGGEGHRLGQCEAGLS